jgi:hypothetical protein
MVLLAWFVRLFEPMNQQPVSKDVKAPVSVEKMMWGAVISVVCFTVILAFVLLRQ